MQSDIFRKLKEIPDKINGLSSYYWRRTPFQSYFYFLVLGEVIQRKIINFVTKFIHWICRNISSWILNFYDAFHPWVNCEKIIVRPWFIEFNWGWLSGVNNPLSNNPFGLPCEFDKRQFNPPPKPLVTVWGSVSLLIHFIVSFTFIVTSLWVYHCLGVKLVISTLGLAEPLGIVIMISFKFCSCAYNVFGISRNS